MTYRLIQIMMTQAGFMTSSLPKQMTKRRTSLPDLDLRYVLSQSALFLTTDLTLLV